MKVVAIIQARMGSTRLPGKSMMEVDNRPIIQYVFDRISPSLLINEVCLATTINTEDDVLEKWAKDQNIKYYRGSTDDVLDRYYQAALLANADVVIRITGDCPLSDYKVINVVLDEYQKGKFDYVCNTQPPTYPDGFDVEVFSFASLKKAWEEAKLKSEREHVTPYIWKNSNIFKIKNVVNQGANMSNFRLTLDTEADFKLISKIIQECNLKNAYCHLFDIINILKIHPEWLELNSQYKRNEGYFKSLKND